MGREETRWAAARYEYLNMWTSVGEVKHSLNVVVSFTQFRWYLFLEFRFSLCAFPMCHQKHSIDVLYAYESTQSNVFLDNLICTEHIHTMERGKRTMTAAKPPHYNQISFFKCFLLLSFYLAGLVFECIFDRFSENERRKNQKKILHIQITIALPIKQLIFTSLIKRRKIISKRNKIQ